MEKSNNTYVVDAAVFISAMLLLAWLFS